MRNNLKSIISTRKGALHEEVILIVGTRREKNRIKTSFSHKGYRISRLYYYLDRIKEYIKSLGLTLNKKKTQIYRVNQGINFLGFKFKLSESGKVIKTLSKENIKKRKRKLRKYKKLVDEGRMTKEKADECYESWKAHTRKGNSYNLLKRMDEYYENLWKE